MDQDGSGWPGFLGLQDRIAGMARIYRIAGLIWMAGIYGIAGWTRMDQDGWDLWDCRILVSDAFYYKGGVDGGGIL